MKIKETCEGKRQTQRYIGNGTQTVRA